MGDWVKIGILLVGQLVLAGMALEGLRADVRHMSRRVEQLEDKVDGISDIKTLIATQVVSTEALERRVDQLEEQVRSKR